MFRLYFCTDVILFHMCNSRECMGVNGEALELCAVYKKPYFILQVMRGSVSGSLNPIGQLTFIHECNLTLTKPQPNPNLTNQIRALKCAVELQTSGSTSHMHCI